MIGHVYARLLFNVESLQPIPGSTFFVDYVARLPFICWSTSIDVSSPSGGRGCFMFLGVE
jgi:hypothetical protein